MVEARHDPLDQGAVQAVGGPALIPAPAVAVVVPISLKCRGRWPLVQVALAHADRQIQPEGTGDRALLSGGAHRDDGYLDRKEKKKTRRVVGPVSVLPWCPFVIYQTGWSDLDGIPVAAMSRLHCPRGH